MGLCLCRSFRGLLWQVYWRRSGGEDHWNVVERVGHHWCVDVLQGSRRVDCLGKFGAELPGISLTLCRISALTLESLSRMSLPSLS